MSLELVSSEHRSHDMSQGGLFYGQGREIRVYRFTADDKNKPTDPSAIVDQCIDALCTDEWFSEVDPKVVREILLEQNPSGPTDGRTLKYTSSRNYGHGLHLLI
ncbi:MAG: hypothetical protein AABX37_00550 [Nanoarchaeota archaeon]